MFSPRPADPTVVAALQGQLDVALLIAILDIEGVASTTMDHVRAVVRALGGQTRVLRVATARAVLSDHALADHVGGPCAYVWATANLDELAVQLRRITRFGGPTLRIAWREGALVEAHALGRTPPVVSPPDPEAPAWVREPAGPDDTVLPLAVATDIRTGLHAFLTAPMDREPRFGESPRWERVSVDVADLLQATPHLRWSDAFALGASEYRAGDNANGRLYAIPRGVSVDVHSGHPLRADVPRGARAIDVALRPTADTALAYVEASVLVREARDFRAEWHGVGWGHHDYVDRAPAWRFVAGEPASLAVRVRREGSHVFVVFFTVSREVEERLWVHLDRYPVGRVDRAERAAFIVARGGLGYVS